MTTSHNPTQHGNQGSGFQPGPAGGDVRQAANPARRSTCLLYTSPSPRDS